MPTICSINKMDLIAPTDHVVARCRSAFQPLSAQLHAFLQDQEGASTVEMVILMAASISMGLSMLNAVSTGIEDLSNDISTFISDYEIVTSFDPPPPEV